MNLDSCFTPTKNGHPDLELFQRKPGRPVSDYVSIVLDEAMMMVRGDLTEEGLRILSIPEAFFVDIEPSENGENDRDVYFRFWTVILNRILGSLPGPRGIGFKENNFRSLAAF